jgi:hypothetical protein
MPHATYCLFAAALVAGSAQAQDVEALKLDTRKNALPVLPKVVAMMQETVAAGAWSKPSRCARRRRRSCSRSSRRRPAGRCRRVSLKTRNPERARRTPGRRQLADFNIRAAGEKIESLETGEIVTENGKPVFRYMRAIPVGDVCLKCHGQAEQIEAGLKSELARNYPLDRAFGYEKGQIRGALTVRRPL